MGIPLVLAMQNIVLDIATVRDVQGVPLATEPGISLIILTHH